MNANIESGTPYQLVVLFYPETSEQVIPVRSMEHAEQIVKGKQVSTIPTIKVNDKVVAIVRGDL